MTHSATLYLRRAYYFKLILFYLQQNFECYDLGLEYWNQVRSHPTNSLSFTYSFEGPTINAILEHEPRAEEFKFKEVQKSPNDTVSVASRKQSSPTSQLIM